MDSNLVSDSKEIVPCVESSEAISISFLAFNKILIIDTNSNNIDEPLVCIKSMVISPQERIRNIREMRLGILGRNSVSVAVSRPNKPQP